MKRVRILASAIGLLGLAAAVTGCAGETTVNNQPAESSGITVTGHGEVQVPPDLGFVHVGVSVTATTVQAARDDAAKAADAVIKSIKGAGVADKDIKTTGLSIQPNYDYSRPAAPRLTGYTVTNTVLATVRKVDDMSKVVDGAIASGGDAVRLQSISFGIDDAAKAREEAREKAMADAKTKAEQLASLGGVSLGAPVTIVESQTWSEGLKTGVAGQGAADSVSTPIETGTNTVTVDVSVRWALK